MNQPNVIDALRAQLGAAEQVRSLRYDGAERKAWEKECVRLLREGFGAESKELAAFLEAPLPRFTPNMSEAEWQDNYDYLLDKQTAVLDEVVALHSHVRPGATDHAGAAPSSNPDTATLASRGPAMPEHPLLAHVQDANVPVPEQVAKAILGLENLLKAGAPWTDVRQQLIVVLTNAEHPVADALLRVLPTVLHLCDRDR